jgi:putative transposase
MKRRRHTPEQVIRKLREADRLLAEGKDVDEVARHLEVSPQTYLNRPGFHAGSRV